MKKPTQKKSNKLYTLYALHLPLLVLLVALMALGSYTFVKSNPGIGTKTSAATVLGDEDDDDDDDDEEEDDSDDDQEDEDDRDEYENDDDEDDDSDDDEDEFEDEMEDEDDDEDEFEDENELEDEDEMEDDDEDEFEDDDDNKTEIQYEREGNKIQIQVESNGQHYKFSSNNVDVNSSFPLRIGDDGTTLYVTTPDGEIALGNIPAMIREQTESQVMAAETQVNDIEIKYDEKVSKVEYMLKGEKDENFLGLVKVKVKVADVYDATSNEFLRSEQSFFSKILDLLSF